MPTPNERNALVFLAALGALGIGLRAWRGSPVVVGAPAAASRDALDRQIGAVDSATRMRQAASRGGSRRHRPPSDTMRGQTSSVPASATPSRRRASARSPGDSDLQRDGRSPATDPDPLARYEARRLEVESQNRLTQSRIDRERNEIRSEATGVDAAAGGSRSPVRARTMPMDLDRAGEEEIALLPGIGPSMAARIVADRAARGPFGSLAGLERVRGVGPGLARRIGALVTFSGHATTVETAVKFHSVRVRPPRP